MTAIQAAEKSAQSGLPDREFIERALNQANLNVLRMAMLQVTGDPELAAIPTVESGIRGGALIAYTIPPEYHQMVRDKARAWLTAGAPTPTSLPTRAEATQLMNIFAGFPLGENDAEFGYEELALEDFPRDLQWSAPEKAAAAAGYKVIVIGAGISGIAASLQLKRLGIPYEVYDRNADIGGTWQTNNYPDARVDTSSYLYQFKFEKNYPWTEFFAARDETLTYLNHIVDKFGLRDAMTFDTELVSAEWQEDRAMWRLDLRDAQGQARTVEANVVISATGLFNKPRRPDIAGLDSFEGQIFHTTEWDRSYDTAGKRVALIGTGSTGAQLAPMVAQDADYLAIYQRTPEWVMAFENYKVKMTPEVRWLFDNVPYYWNWYCFSSHLTGQSMQGLQYHDRDWQAQGGKVNPRNDKVREVLVDYIRSKVDGDPDLLARLTPEHAPLVRRLVVDSGFYDTVMRDNVELVSDAIDRVTARGIRTQDGVERPFDLIALGTGFETAEYFWPTEYTGRNGARLEQMWEKDGARAYLGITMPDFPNFFIFYGPNGSPRSGGFYSWAEVWARYVVGGIVGLIEGGNHTIEVKGDVFEEYNARMDDAMVDLIWEMGGASYYVNGHGRSGIFMPWETQDYHRMVRRIDLADFQLDGAG